jgi:hypothetical protein
MLTTLPSVVCAFLPMSRYAGLQCGFVVDGGDGVRQFGDERKRQRRRRWGRIFVSTTAAATEDKADADVLQTPPTTNHEVLLRHQSESGCQRSQAAGPEDWTLETRTPGENDD